VTDAQRAAGAEAIAQARYYRATPSARAGDWDWLPARAKRQWLEDAREDLAVALLAMGR
jgi:hypothetical protein